MTTASAEEIVSNYFKNVGSRVWFVKPEYNEMGLPKSESLVKLFAQIKALVREGAVLSAYTPGYGGVAEAVMKMCFGEDLSFDYDSGISVEEIFAYSYGAFVLELKDGYTIGKLLGTVTDSGSITYKEEKVSCPELLDRYENKLEPVFPAI